MGFFLISLGEVLDIKKCEEDFEARGGAYGGAYSAVFFWRG